MDTKKFSMVEVHKAKAERCMRRVLYLLGWDEERYCWYKYMCGLRYLDAYLKGDADGKNLLEHSRIFWNWWKLHWTLREESYLEDAERLDKVKLVTRKKVFFEVHNPFTLAADFHPNSTVLTESYAEMIGELNKELKEAAI